MCARRSNAAENILAQGDLGGGAEVSSQAEFYRRLWLGPVEQDVQLVVMRAARLEAITVRPVDRYRLLKTSDR